MSKMTALREEGPATWVISARLAQLDAVAPAAPSKPRAITISARAPAAPLHQGEGRPGGLQQPAQEGTIQSPSASEASCHGGLDSREETPMEGMPHRSITLAAAPLQGPYFIQDNRAAWNAGSAGLWTNTALIALY